MEKYSRGGHAEVFRINLNEGIWYPNADLVRVENSDHPLIFMTRFYAHRIASELFSSYFIQTYGARRTDVHVPIFRMKYNHYLYSKLAQVPRDHAIFTAHVVFRSLAEEHDWTDTVIKDSTCKCSACHRHRKFHKDNKLKDQASYMFTRFADIGIIPDNDFTDYCLTDRGNLIFFEVDSIDINRLRPFLESIKDPNQRQRHALRMLNRYQELCELPRAVREVTKQVA